MSKLDGLGKKQIVALVPIELHEKYKASGMVARKIFEFGLLYGDEKSYSRQLEAACGNFQKEMTRLGEKMIILNNNIQRLNLFGDYVEQKIGKELYNQIQNEFYKIEIQKDMKKDESKQGDTHE
jgi:hypothetical protein